MTRSDHVLIALAVLAVVGLFVAVFSLAHRSNQEWNRRPCKEFRDVAVGSVPLRCMPGYKESS